MFKNDKWKKKNDSIEREAIVSRAKPESAGQISAVKSDIFYSHKRTQ